MEETKKRSRDDSVDSDQLELEVKKIREDLLGILDDFEPDPDSLRLDSVFKSFQDEIVSLSSSSAPSPAPVVVVDLTADSAGDSQPELGFLLEASDDDLGLPPSSVNSSGEEVKSDWVLFNSFGDLWGFEDHVPSYEWFELIDHGVISDSEYVAFGDVGLFEYSDDVCFASTAFSGFS